MVKSSASRWIQPTSEAPEYLVCGFCAEPVNLQAGLMGCGLLNIMPCGGRLASPAYGRIGLA
jgi:hypothetical protein